MQCCAMPAKTHPSSKAGGHHSSRRLSRRGGKQRRSLASHNKSQQRFQGFDESSSSDSSDRYTRLGRIGPAAQSHSRTIDTDASTGGGGGLPADLDQSNLSFISNGSDAILQRYENLLNRMASPSGDRARRRKSPSRQQQKLPAQTGKSDSGGGKQQKQQLMLRPSHSNQLCSRHRREMRPSGKSGASGGGNGGGAGRGNDGSGGNGGACTQRSGSPSGSVTRSGEPSSQIAYQAALSPLTSDSDDRALKQDRSRRRSGGIGSDRQLVRLAARDANSSNRQQSLPRSRASRHALPPSPSPPPLPRLPQPPQQKRQQHHQRQQEQHLQNHRGRTESSRDRYSKYSKSTMWDDDASNLSSIYENGYSGTGDRRRQSPMQGRSKKQLAARRADQQQQEEQDCLSADIYSGNHIESNVHVRQKLNSLRRLYSLRNQRHDNRSNHRSRQKDDHESVGASSWDNSDREEPSPRTLRFQMQQRHQQQLLRHQPQEVAKTKRRGKSSLIGERPIGETLRQIYFDEEERQRRSARESHLSRRPSRRGMSSGWLEDEDFNDDDSEELDDIDGDCGDDDGFSMEVLPPRSGDGLNSGANCDRGDQRWSGGDAAYRRLARKLNNKAAGRPTRLDKLDQLNRCDKRLDRPHRLVCTSQAAPARGGFAMSPQPSHNEVPTKRRAWSPTALGPDCGGDRGCGSGGGVRSGGGIGGGGPPPWSGRSSRQTTAAGPPADAASSKRHWCNNGGRMRETKSRRDTIFSCPYVSLSLQTKTYECARCAGYLDHANNLNSKSNHPDQETTASTESLASALPGYRPGNRRAADDREFDASRNRTTVRHRTELSERRIRRVGQRSP